MKKSWFTEQKILEILKQGQMGIESRSFAGKTASAGTRITCGASGAGPALAERPRDHRRQLALSNAKGATRPNLTGESAPRWHHRLSASGAGAAIR
jgi:hypothetical protein